MEWLEYYEALLKNRLITPIWKEVLSLLEGEIENVSGKDDYLVLLSILFSLVDEGNICMQQLANLLNSVYYRGCFDKFIQKNLPFHNFLSNSDRRYSSSSALSRYFLAASTRRTSIRGRPSKVVLRV